MKTLDKNWLTEGLLDFELKKYTLLAYLQEVKFGFSDMKLYPFLSDLIFHYNNLMKLRENKRIIYDQFPRLMSKVDFEKLKITYEKIIDDDDIMIFLEEILEYSIPQISESMSEGKHIYEFVEENTEISPVGISPLYPDIGYIFLNQYNKKETYIYQYQITIFERADEKYRGIHTHFVESYTKKVTNTFENIKIDLTRKYKELPNPATYLINCKVICPIDETLLPIAKRLVVKYVASEG